MHPQHWGQQCHDRQHRIETIFAIRGFTTTSFTNYRIDKTIEIKIDDKREWEEMIDNTIVQKQDGINSVLGLVGSGDKNNRNCNNNIGIGIKTLHSINPIGAGHKWDNYVRQTQHSRSSSTRQSSITRSSATTWARHQDGGHRAKIYLNIFHLQASWYIATWSSASTKMSAIILPQDPRAHHDLLPDILSHTITYILSTDLPRVELKSHLSSALHAEPPGVAYQSQNNIRVMLRRLDLQPPPRQHHRDLIDRLRCYLGSYQALRGCIMKQGACPWDPMLASNSYTPWPQPLNLLQSKARRSSLLPSRTLTWVCNW